MAFTLFQTFLLRAQTGWSFRSTSAAEKPGCQEAYFSLVCSVGRSLKCVYSEAEVVLLEALTTVTAERRGFLKESHLAS